MAIEIYKTEEFSRWYQRLRNPMARQLIRSRLNRIMINGSLGDAKSVGEGVLELRIYTGPGYRVYCAWRGGRLLVLLAGGDKSTQARDIARAKQLNRESGLYWSNE